MKCSNCNESAGTLNADGNCAKCAITALTHGHYNPRVEDRNYTPDYNDAIDYRAMLAREVWAERMWRIYSIAVKPWMFASYETDKPGACRTEMETINGETL